MSDVNTCPACGATLSRPKGKRWFFGGEVLGVLLFVVALFTGIPWWAVLVIGVLTAVAFALRRFAPQPIWLECTACGHRRVIESGVVTDLGGPSAT
jgi:hypothetical protein